MQPITPVTAEYVGLALDVKSEIVGNRIHIQNNQYVGMRTRLQVTQNLMTAQKAIQIWPLMHINIFMPSTTPDGFAAFLKFHLEKQLL